MTRTMTPVCCSKRIHDAYGLWLLTALIAVTPQTLSADPLRLVSPPEFTDMPGDDYGGGSESLRVQHLHRPDAFVQLLDRPASARWLVGWAIRPDESVVNPARMRAPVTITLSASPIDELDTDFESNFGTSRTIVFDGMSEWQGPGEFSYYLGLQRHFLYDPRDGALLDDMVWPQGFSAAVRFDGAITDAITSVGTFGNPSATVAAESWEWLPVIQFVFAERGDFQGDLVIDVNDINLLSSQLKQGSNDLRFDVNDDGKLDKADHLAWVHEVARTWVGDANLDGQFTSKDFSDVFLAGLYETGALATWGEGDWNADQLFDSGDFVAAFVDGGYELGPRPAHAVTSVPEPAALSLALIALGALAARVKRASAS